MGNQQATEVELGWLAGIYDGEGYMGLTRQNSKKVRSIRPDIQLVNCDPDVILKTRMILNKIDINPYIRERIHSKKGTEAHWSRNYILSISKFSDVKKFIDTLGQFLTGEKKKRAGLMIRLVNSRIPKTKRDRYTSEELAMVDEYFENMKGVKFRGNTTTAHLNDYQANVRMDLLAKV